MAGRFAGQSDYAEVGTLGAPKARRIEIVAPSFTLVPMLLPGTELIATLPARLARMAQRWLPITIRLLPFDAPTFHEQVQWHSDRNEDAALRWLVAALQEACR